MKKNLQIRFSKPSLFPITDFIDQLLHLCTWGRYDFSFTMYVGWLLKRRCHGGWGLIMPAYQPEVYFHFFAELKRLIICVGAILTFDTIYIGRYDSEIEQELKKIFGGPHDCCDEVRASTWKEHWKYIKYTLWESKKL